jgi:serine/threonine-protein kinase
LGSEEEKSRFVREAQAAAALDHPNVCTTYEIDEAEGQIFISMAYLHGQSLDEKIKSGSLNLDEAVNLAIQVAEGLREAHDKNIFHRDIKSSNIMVSGKGQAKIMDFGLAKLAGRTMLTKTKTIMGTVEYMSPEQALGESADHRTDIWSLGVVLYEMLTGSVPFAAPNDAALIHKIIYDEPVAVKSLNPDVPPGLSVVVARAMTKNKEDRYASISEFLEDIRNFQTLRAEEPALIKEKTYTENQEAYKKAEKRVRARLRFYRHLAFYLGVHVLLMIINLATSPGYLWFMWPFFVWGIFVFFHGLSVFAFSKGSSIRERMIEKELNK